MTFRTEEKLDINKYSIISFKKWLLSNSATKLYNDRLVASIYFDNFYFSMYKDSIEGTLPRKKIRLRSYNNVISFEKFNQFEIKISSTEGRFKKSKIITDNSQYFKFGYFDSNYGVCKPVLLVSYLRSYYNVFGLRVTIDDEIKYYKFQNSIKSIQKKDNNPIVEVKSTNKNISENINNLFPFNKIRFSKYSRGIDLLNFM